MESTKFSPVSGLKLLRTSSILRVVATCLAFVNMIATTIGIGVVLSQGIKYVANMITPPVDTFAFMGVFGIVGGFVVLLITVSGLMEIIALAKISHSHAKYKTALILVVASIGVSLLSGVATMVSQSKMIGNVMGALNPALLALVVYFVISATTNLLNKKGDVALATKGVKVRNVYIICAAISFVAEMLAFVPSIAPVLLIFTTIAALIQLVALFKYIGFLGKSAKALQA